MNEKVNADLKSLKFILNKNKPYILAIVLVLVSVFLFFQFVIPQFNAFLVTRKEAEAAKLKLATLQANLSVLSNINGQTLNTQLEILKSALPANKDFIGILNSVYAASQKTGVSLGSFSIVIGDPAKSADSEGSPAVTLSAPVNAGVAAINSFIETIGKTIPLAQVSAVKVSGPSSTVSISFYYKPLGAADYNQDAPIVPVSQRAVSLVAQLSGFDNAYSFSQFSPAPVASSSAAN